MSPRKITKKHRVEATLENCDLVRAKSALKLIMYAHGERIGKLDIGRGSLYWTGANRHKSKRIS